MRIKKKFNELTQITILIKEYVFFSFRINIWKDLCVISYCLFIKPDYIVRSRYNTELAIHMYVCMMYSWHIEA